MCTWLFGFSYIDAFKFIFLLSKKVYFLLLFRTIIKNANFVKYFEKPYHQAIKD